MCLRRLMIRGYSGCIFYNLYSYICCWLLFYYSCSHFTTQHYEVWYLQSTSREIRGKGKFLMVDIIDFFLTLLYCVRQITTKIFFRVWNYYWKKMESKIVVARSRLCTHYFNVYTIWPNKIFEIEWLRKERNVVVTNCDESV